jgi:hypothetical protein
MNRELFGDFVYSGDGECWTATRPLSRFARLARSRFGDPDDQPPPGLFPVRVADPEHKGPSAEQEAAYRHLLENEETLAETVLITLLSSLWQADPDSAIKTPQELTKVSQLTCVAIAREHHHGMAYLVFHVDCNWEMEHGMNVVYHKDRPAAWTWDDGIDELLLSDQDVADLQLPPPPNQQLFEALEANDARRVARLRAQGHDINDVGPRRRAPLCEAVYRLDVDLVKRLLAAGADPNLRDREDQTPLQRAHEMMTLVHAEPLSPEPHEGRLMRLIGRPLLDFFNRRIANYSIKRLRVIIGLLEAAGGK